jgi:hypothetical protein
MSNPVSFAIRLLVWGGIGNLVLSFLLGWVLSVYRTKQKIEPHHWLLVAHTVSLQEGLLLLGIAFTIPYTHLSERTAALAASLLVAASVFQDLSGVVNWLLKTRDQFAERSAGWILASVNAVLNTVGLLIVAVGVCT